MLVPVTASGTGSLPSLADSWLFLCHLLALHKCLKAYNGVVAA